MKIVRMQTKTFWKGELGIDGIVEDEGVSYTVRLEVKDKNINSYSCSCIRGDSYKEMCSHGQALYRYYGEKRDEKDTRPVSTSSEARAMIREYTNREVAAILMQGTEEPVELCFRLLISRQEPKAEFWVGRERRYVIKDLGAFARAVEQGAYVEYGKGLAFHHNLEVFSENSRPLVLLLLEIMGTCQDFLKQFQKSTFGAKPVVRELNLSKGNRDRFFQLMEGRRLEVQDTQGGRRILEVCRKNPEIPVYVRKAGKNGLKVWIDKQVYSFMGEKYLYVADQEHLYWCDQQFSQDLQVLFEQMTQGSGAPYEVTVGERDVPLFYERVLKKIEIYGILDVKDLELESLKSVELKARFTFESPDAGEIRMYPKLSYGDYSFCPTEDEHVPKTICRDVPGEFRISQVITKYFKHRDSQDGSLVIRNDEEAVFRLLSEGIGEFEKLGMVYLPGDFSHMRLLPSPKVSVGVRTMEDWLELTMDLGELNGADLSKILDAYRQKKSYYRLKSGEFLKLEGNGLLTVARMVDGLAVSKGELQKGTVKVPRYRALYLDSMYREYGEISLNGDQSYKSVVRGMKSVEDSDFEIPKPFSQVLREYQKTGFRWLKTLDAWGFGGILADGMGLGKTVQIISILYEESLKEKQNTSLILCPASLVYNWELELKRFAPSLKVLVVTGNAQEREERLLHMEEYHVVVTSYDLLKRDIGWYENMVFRFQVIDEAQYIKNPLTQNARTVKAIRAVTRFALTGTPVENSLSELWSIFDYLMPGFLYTYQKFKKTYEIPIVKEGDRTAVDGLKRTISPFILRRLKSQVLKELPEKLETVVYSKMEEKQRELYLASVWKFKESLTDDNKIQILSALTRLRQICCDPRLIYENYKTGSAKLETCMDLVFSGVDGGHKILLFSQFASMLELIGARLSKEGIRFYRLTGETSKEERLKMIQAFQREEVPVFLISLKAGGTGLNLTAADMVIHYDPWWNVAAQDQATDRAHRIGQDKQVTVFKLITKDTIEENILKLQASKQALADQVVTEGMVSLGSLSREELLALL